MGHFSVLNIKQAENYNFECFLVRNFKYQMVIDDVDQQTADKKKWLTEIMTR